jgi:hypothetical protein
MAETSQPPDAPATPVREGAPEIPLGQRLFESPFLLLLAGLFVMFLFYTGWGMFEILTLPAGKLP